MATRTFAFWQPPTLGSGQKDAAFPREKPPILNFVHVAAICRFRAKIPSRQPVELERTTYDAWNRMVVAANSSGTVLTNEYDGNHHRIRKIVNGGDTFDYYYNDKWQLLTEVKNGSTYALYVWHLYYIDALAVRMRASDMHYFLHDANFNVTAAYDITSGSGTDRQVVERYAYTPYGEVTILDANFSVDGDQLSDIDNYHLYTGREREPETGLQLNRNRYYHAPLGRWLTRDPIGYEGDRNLYAYVACTPVSFVDPFGLEGLPPYMTPGLIAFIMSPGCMDGDSPWGRVERCNFFDSCKRMYEKIKNFEKAIRCHREHDRVTCRPDRHSIEIAEFENGLERCWRYWKQRCRPRNPPKPPVKPGTPTNPAVDPIQIPILVPLPIAIGNPLPPPAVGLPPSTFLPPAAQPWLPPVQTPLPPATSPCPCPAKRPWFKLNPPSKWCPIKEWPGRILRLPLLIMPHIPEQTCPDGTPLA